MNYVLRGTVSWQPPMRQDAVRRGGSEGDVMDACIQAINDAVEDFLTTSLAKPPQDTDLQKEIQDTAPQSTALESAPRLAEPAIQTTAPLIPVPETVAKAPVAPSNPATARETPASPTDPAARVEPVPKQDLPFVKTIDSDNGPVRANERRPSTGGGGNGRTPDSGGGGGGGGNPNQQGFHKRSEPVNFARSLQQAMAAIRRNMAVVMIFTIAINVLLLAIPIYLFQISDRVLTSRSMDTLVMLTIAVIGAVLLQAFMDSVRRFILMRVAVETEARLGGPVLSAAAKAAQSGSSREFQTLADLQHLRSFITGPVLLTMFDTPVSPVYFAVVFLIHPDLGFIALASGVALVVVALVNQQEMAVIRTMNSDRPISSSGMKPSRA